MKIHEKNDEKNRFLTKNQKHHRNFDPDPPLDAELDEELAIFIEAEFAPKIEKINEQY